MKPQNKNHLTKIEAVAINSNLSHKYQVLVMKIRKIKKHLTHTFNTEKNKNIELYLIHINNTNK